MGFIGLLKFSLICIDLLAWPVLALVYPLLASIRAIESCSKYHLRKLAIYWTVFALISLFEFAFVKIIEWIPFWSSIKLVVTMWLVLPKFDGACIAYQCIVCPWLLVKLQAVMDRFYQPKKEKLHNMETFLDVADKYIKENGYEALEKLISIKRDCQVLDNSSRGILVLESEEKVVAAVSEQVQEEEEEETASSRRRRRKRNVEEQESASFHSSSSTTLENLEEPNSAKTRDEVKATMKSAPVQNSKPVSVAAAEIHETTPSQDSPKTPPVKKIEQEWNCVLCQVTTTCEKNLKSHLRGKKHKLMCDSLKASFMQNKGKQEADKSKTREGSQQIPHKKTKGVKKQNANQPLKGRKTNNIMPLHTMGWRRPPPGWFKLNTDGSLFKNPTSATAGGVVRDEHGQWATGFAIKLKTEDVTMAELLGLCEGLKIAWGKRYEKLEVECDSKNVVEMVKTARIEEHPLGLLIHDCRCLLRKPWQCSLKHVKRDCNTLADRLAKLGQIIGTDFCPWDHFPEELKGD